MSEWPPENPPLVSAIVCVRNGERFLADSIGSILAQDYENLELIVVENGSDDGSGDTARALAPNAKVTSIPACDLAVARNMCVDLAQGELIANCDADDIWTPGRITAMVEAILAKPSAWLVYGAIETFHCPLLPDSEQSRLLAPQPPVVGRIPGTCLFRSELFERIGAFNPDAGMADFGEWLGRVRGAGFEETMIDTLVLRRRLHTASLTFVSRDRSDYAQALAMGLRARRANDGGA